MSLLNFGWKIVLWPFLFARILLVWPRKIQGHLYRADKKGKIQLWAGLRFRCLMEWRRCCFYHSRLARGVYCGRVGFCWPWIGPGGPGQGPNKLDGIHGPLTCLDEHYQVLNIHSYNDDYTYRLSSAVQCMYGLCIKPT